jgi:hypothetical protein
MGERTVPEEPSGTVLAFVIPCSKFNGILYPKWCKSWFPYPLIALLVGERRKMESEERPCVVCKFQLGTYHE